MKQRERAKYLRRLHDRKPLILPNAWDAGSARVIEAAGALAVGTTSAGVSWSFGRRDGQSLTCDQMLQVIENIVCRVSIPVTADIESGYGSGSIEEIVELTKSLVAIGVAGVNIEDSPGPSGEYLLPAEVHAARIKAMRHAVERVGADLVINARTDVFLFEVDEADTRFDATVKRARRYLDAGADCIFVPGVDDDETISNLTKAIAGPVNICATSRTSSASRLGELGVARVSVGPGLFQAAMAAVERAACEFIELGTCRFLDESLSFTEILKMLQEPQSDWAMEWPRGDMNPGNSPYNEP